VRDFAAVVLKGLVEQNDSGAYFGSTLALASHEREAQRHGWIADGKVTQVGRDAYVTLRLGDLPKRGRATEWRSL
jgi:hypothetical protein